MKFISLFAGVGGFDLALERLGHECVYANEWDKYAAQTYEKNFKRKPDTRSITDVIAENIPDHDLLVGGFPCQSFSIAGRRAGFKDTRGTLFFEIARILRQKQPRLVLLENVKGLLSHDSGKTFGVIITSLDELGYDLQWQVLNSKNFGVPQNRERVFIVGHLRGTPKPKVFPIGEGIQGIVEGAKQTAVNTLTAGGHSGGHHSSMTLLQLNQPTHSNDRVYSKEGIRRLTPIECERLQGFPDNWTEGVSDTQRYKQMGNAVTVNVIYEIMKNL